MMRAFFALLFVMYVSVVNAEQLLDPTRPPAALLEGRGEESLAEKAVVTRSSGLQSTIISPTRRAAIIDERTVELGGMYGDAQLVEVSEGSVVLQTGQARRTLTLFPGVNMTRSETNVNQIPPKSGFQSDKIVIKKSAISNKQLLVHPKERK